MTFKSLAGIILHTVCLPRLDQVAWALLESFGSGVALKLRSISVLHVGQGPLRPLAGVQGAVTR